MWKKIELAFERKLYNMYVTDSGQRIEINNLSVKNVSKCKKLIESPTEHDKIESKSVK